MSNQRHTAMGHMLLNPTPVAPNMVIPSMNFSEGLISRLCCDGILIRCCTGDVALRLIVPTNKSLKLCIGFGQREALFI